MPSCTYCKREIEPGTGKLLIQNTGKQVWLCSSKCEKNMFKLKRKPAKVSWIRKQKK